MKLDRVTITGADDSIDPESLAALSIEYPFAEWGILFSRSREGSPRYPTLEWLFRLEGVAKRGPLKLSAHLCGGLVRAVVLAGMLPHRELDFLWPHLERVQLNFHGEYHRACPEFTDLLRKHADKSWILQHDGVNDGLIMAFMAHSDARVYPLFDTSGGAGRLPKEWPKPIWNYCGYAGGLGPDNLEHELGRIREAAGDARIWIDMETKVRSDDDQKFDLGKVEQCLKIAAPHVVKETSHG